MVQNVNYFKKRTYSPRKRAAFTLAEVLITLGIIGIVAAMTMPALIANHKKSEVETKLKKIYSVMNQAIMMSVAEYGDVQNWAADCGTSGNVKCNTDEAIEWFNKYIGKHLEIISIENYNDNRLLVYLKDGSVLLIANYMYDMAFYLNKKALPEPGKNSDFGKNAFAFRFNPVLSAGQVASNNIYTIKATFEPYTYSWDGTREDLLDNPTYGCKSGKYHNFCTKLIQYEGWKIPKDYPIRLQF